MADGSVGVGSRIVLGAWESHVQGEGLDGSTQSPQRKLMPDAEDWERHEFTSRPGIADKAKRKPGCRRRMKSLLTAKASTTEEPREGKLHAGICAGSAG